MTAHDDLHYASSLLNYKTKYSIHELTKSGQITPKSGFEDGFATVADNVDVNDDNSDNDTMTSVPHYLK